MPLPSDAFTVPGGCNCGAIRYRIEVPQASARPLHPRSRPSATTPPTHLPIIFTDHCNDCRRSNGSIIPAWICGPVEWLTVELLPRPARSGSQRDPQFQSGPAADAVVTGECPPLTMTGSQAFSVHGRDTANTYLQYYESSPGCTRSFCARCGTHLSFLAPEYMPDLVDVVLGTVDRELLEKEWMVPSRQAWWELGLDWIKALSVGGGWAGMGRHPKGDYNEYVRKEGKEMET